MALIKRESEIVINEETKKVTKKSSLKVLGIKVSASEKTIDSWLDEGLYADLFSL